MVKHILKLNSISQIYSSDWCAHMEDGVISATPHFDPSSHISDTYKYVILRVERGCNEGLSVWMT